MESQPSTKEDEDYEFRALRHEDFEPMDEASYNNQTVKFHKHRTLNLIVMCGSGEKDLATKIQSINDNSFVQQFYDEQKQKFFYLGGGRIIYAK